MIPEGSQYDRLAGGPGRCPNLAGVQGFTQKPKTEYTDGEESKTKQTRPFSPCVSQCWGLLIVISLQGND